MRKYVKITALILALVLCLSMLTACGGTGNAESPTPETQSPEVHTPDVQEPETQEPEAEPSEEAEEEDTRIVKEDYVFEGPGILTDFVVYPDSYKQEAAQQGRVEVVTYDNGIEEKYFNIYLPYGYDTSDRSYNVLYLMHGGNGRPEIYLQVDHASSDQKLVDNMIQNGEVEPFIIVAPSWNSSVPLSDLDEGKDEGMVLAERFAAEELTQYVIPLVDGNYRTNATREGRAFSGFSLGGVTTWYIFLHDLAYVKYFVPMSGDCWAIEQTGGLTKPVETVAALEQAVAYQGYTGEDFVLYTLTGTQDYALPNIAPQIYAMQDSELFIFGENTYFGAYPDGTHMGTYSRIYLYNVLPLLWQET